MQSLMDEVAARNGRPGNRGCSIERFLNEQESWPAPEGRDRRPTSAEWEEVFANSTLQHTAIHAVMRAYGYEAGRSTVERHRKGECPCPKT